MSRFHFGKIFPVTAQHLTPCINNGDFTYAYHDIPTKSDIPHLESFLNFMVFSWLTVYWFTSFP